MKVTSAGSETPFDARTLLYRLLHEALTTMRNLAGYPLSEGDRVLVHYLADWVHNWPNWLREAQTTRDFEDIWNSAGNDCHPSIRDWVRQAIHNTGVTPSEFGLRDI